MMRTKLSNIFWVKADKNIEFKYMGCFKDDTTRLIQHFLGNVTSTDECRTLAIKENFDTFGL